MKKLLTLFFIIFVSLLFVGSDPSEGIKVESITLVDSELIYSEDFELSDILVEVKMSDGTKSEIPLSSDMISTADFEKLRTTGNHQIKVNYLSTEQTLNINIRADETEFRVSDNYIQWKYKSEATWKNLVSLNDLKGAAGSSPTVEISNDGYWVIDGIKTTTKAVGENGEDGSSPTVAISEDGYWVIDAVKTSAKAVGEDGKDGSSPKVTISEDGYWVIDGVKTNFKAVPDSPTLENYTVSYVLNGGTLQEGEESITLPSGSPLDLPIPIKENYLFLGWFDEESYEFTKYDVVNQDLVLYAKWKNAPTEIEDFLNSFMSDNYTMTVYSFTNHNSEYFNEEQVQIKKAVTDDLITHYINEPVHDSYYLAYDKNNLYFLWEYNNNFEFQPFNEEILEDELFYINTNAINNFDIYYE
ncbi:MAG: InlB B-repeat-containing protein, partial [Bacilli bacterium]|nr:InlB B-repeat-containing protein [Bacilli bacterium]